MDQKFDTTDHGTDGPKAFPAPNVETQYYDDASILMCQSFCYAAPLKATYGQPERGVVKWRKSLWGGRGFFDICDVIGNYKGDVLILHGDRDGIAPLRYSERAVDVFENGELMVMEGQNHGFVGKARTEAMERETAFFREHSL